MESWIAYLSSQLARIATEIQAVGWGWWLLLTFPLLLFGDFLYYYVSSVLAAVITACRRDQEAANLERHQLFLERLPRVSVVIAGRNEAACIGNCIRSLRETGYPNLEIIFVDDSSDDDTYEVAAKFANRGEIRLFRNAADSGRGGRPSATNLGVRVATGEFIISGDADTTFDRDLIVHMIGPFCDPTVGVVAGNLKARNANVNLTTRMQAIEYLVGIGLGKRWTDIRGVTHQASGALGAFRRSAVESVGFWDAELAEDTDISLKVQRAGWRVKFAPRAIALTNVPESLRAVGRQRYRWDRGALRTFYHKHGSLVNPFQHRPAFAIELLLLYFFSTIAVLMFPVYVVVMLYWDPMKLLILLAMSYVFYLTGSMVATAAAVWISERRTQEWPLIFWSLLVPFYKEYLRWVRFDATVHELLRLNYEDSFLPSSAWRCAPRW